MSAPEHVLVMRVCRADMTSRDGFHPRGEEAVSASDVTITTAHRTALRRIDRGEPVGDLGGALGALYLFDLIRDEGDRIVLSPDGRKVLDAHDALEKTRPTARPTLELPAGWREEAGSLMHRDVEEPVAVALLRCDSDMSLTRQVREAEAVLELLRYERARRTLARMVELREQGAAVSP